MTLLPILKLDQNWLWFVQLVDESGRVIFVSTKRFFSLTQAKAEFDNLLIVAVAVNDN